MLMSVPVVPARMEDRGVIKSMDITVAVNRDSMEFAARSVKMPRFVSVCFWASIDTNKTMFACRR